MAETKDSSNWVKASMPSAAINSFGQVASSSGSTTAYSATRHSWRKDFLYSPGTLNTAFLVASLPAPAVVGAAMKGREGPW